MPFAYKLFTRTAPTTLRTYERVDSYSSLFMAGFISVLALVYIRKNVSENKWEWYRFVSHAIIGAVMVAATTFYRMPSFSLSTLLLVAAGFVFGHVIDASISPWVDVSTLVMMIGTIENRKNITLVTLGILAAYALFLFAQVPLEGGAGMILLTAVVKSISLIAADNAVTEIPWSVLLSAYNAVQLINIPTNTDDKFQNDDLLILTGVGVLLFMLQWICVVWISNIGPISYILGMLLLDMLFIMATDIPDEVLYAGWFSVFVVTFVYSTYPWTQNLPDREPSVPPLPDDEIPPLPPATPKTKHENSTPSAPLGPPETNPEVPSQGEIV